MCYNSGEREREKTIVKPNTVIHDGGSMAMQNPRVSWIRWFHDDCAVFSFISANKTRPSVPSLVEIASRWFCNAIIIKKKNYGYYYYYYSERSRALQHQIGHLLFIYSSSDTINNDTSVGQGLTLKLYRKDM